MQHLFFATVRLLERKAVGSEDGTPIYAEVEVWKGAGRMDLPQMVLVKGSSGAARKYEQRTTVFAMPDCPATENLHVEVELNELQQLEMGQSRCTRWRIDGVATAAGMAHLHHLELDVCRIKEP